MTALEPSDGWSRWRGKSHDRWGASFGEEGLFTGASPPNAIDIFEAYLQSTLDRVQAEGLSLDDNEERQLRVWLWQPGTVRRTR